MRPPSRRTGCCVVALMLGLAFACPPEARAQGRRDRAPNAVNELVDEIQKRGGLPATFNTPGANQGFAGDPLAGVGRASAAQYNFALSTYRERQRRARRMSNPANWPIDPLTGIRYRPRPFEVSGPYIPGVGELASDEAKNPAKSINMGLGSPEFVYGGVHIPGYGVNSGFGGVYDVNGGLYVPGLGVVSGWDGAVGVPGVLRVNGGLLIPGFGVVPDGNMTVVQTPEVEGDGDR